MSYKRVELNDIIFKEEPTPSSVALADVVPFDWDEDVQSGKKKISISRQTEDKPECVK